MTPSEKLQIALLCVFYAGVLVGVLWHWLAGRD